MSLFRFTRKGTGQYSCDPGLLYEALTDYDNYFEWAPRIAKSKLLAKEGDLAIVEFVLAEPRGVRVAIECVHTRNKMVLWRPIEGNMPIARVEWTIEPAEQEQSRLTLKIEVKPSLYLFLPQFLNFTSPAQYLKDLRSHLAVFQPELTLPGPAGEKILELTETDEGVVVWLRGRKYTLKAD
jgi:hypothetical protein